MTAAAAMIAVLAGGSAQATPIAAGGSVPASMVQVGALTQVGLFNNVAFTSQAPAGQTSTFSGVYTDGVFKDTNNTLCSMAGQCLTFIIQITNNSTSRDGLETVTTGPLSNLFTYNVGYNNANGGVAPLYISDSAFGALSFNFTGAGNTSNLLSPGLGSDYLIIQSSATSFTSGSISIQDSQTATVAGYIPAGSAVAAVPEPATWLTMILGFGLIGFAMRTAARRSERKFDAKIKRISEGAFA